MFVIIEQDMTGSPLDLVCLDDEGQIAIFKTHAEAEQYAKENLAFKWTVAELTG